MPLPELVRSVAGDESSAGFQAAAPHPGRAGVDAFAGDAPASSQTMCCRDLFDEVRRRLARKGYRWE